MILLFAYAAFGRFDYKGYAHEYFQYVLPFCHKLEVAHEIAVVAGEEYEGVVIGAAIFLMPVRLRRFFHLSVLRLRNKRA